MSLPLSRRLREAFGVQTKFRIVGEGSPERLIRKGELDLPGEAPALEAGEA